ncbi:MAG: AI-2E family transporter [Ruminococcus sp.]|nr:AI-2E family transporter [Ruminococcus sp.]MCM1479554.1 AI-2E family transporter [Muribaculaceae bacterium]
MYNIRDNVKKATKGRDILKVDFNKKYNTIAVYCIITFAVCLALVIICMRSTEIFGYIKQFFKVIAPVTWGIAIAYICNPIVKVLERLFKKIFDKKKPHPKLNRSLSVFISMILLITVISAILALVIIQVRDSVVEILYNIPSYINQLENLVVKLLGDYPDAVKFIEGQLETIQPTIMDYANNIISRLGDNFVKVKDGAIGFVVSMKDFIIGFIVAIYLLFSKEIFTAQARKITYALFPKPLCKGILRTCAKANQTLSGFLSGKLLDSFIIGVICFVVMRIANWEFVALISIIIGVTNIIPFFGPFFGAVPSALLLLMTNPKHVIPFVIFIIILQQFDGNILGPKILGDSTGLSPFWVMFAIFVGGGLFGFMGMLLGVPVFAVIYALLSEFFAYLLKKKRLSHSTSDYKELDINNPPAARAAVSAAVETEVKPEAAEKK